MPIDLHEVTEFASQFPVNNIDDAKNVLVNLGSNDMSIIITNKATNISHGTHCHDDYEFNINYCNMPSAVIGSKISDIPANTLLAVNPAQEHGFTLDMKGFNACGIHVDKNFLQSVSDSIYGSRNIFFSTDTFVINHDISMLMRLFLEELKYKQTGYEFIAENLSLLIIGGFMRLIKHNLTDKPHNIPKGNKENIKKVIDYMNENYTSDISCAELSSLIKMDKYSFIRSFKAQTGKTPYEYLLDLKIEKAKKMLHINEYSITEISMMCGFSSHSHFTSTFKKKTGISPTGYKKGFY